MSRHRFEVGDEVRTWTLFARTTYGTITDATPEGLYVRWAGRKNAVLYRPELGYLFHKMKNDEGNDEGHE